VEELRKTTIMSNNLAGCELGYLKLSWKIFYYVIPHGWTAGDHLINRWNNNTACSPSIFPVNRLSSLSLPGMCGIDCG